MKAVIFLGSPHFGSDFAGWGVAAAQILRPLGSNSAILEGLKYDSLSLHDLHRDFIGNSPSVRVVNFFEERGTRLCKVGMFKWDKLVSRMVQSSMLI